MLSSPCVWFPSSVSSFSSQPCLRPGSPCSFYTFNGLTRLSITGLGLYCISGSPEWPLGHMGVLGHSLSSHSLGRSVTHVTTRKICQDVTVGSHSLSNDRPQSCLLWSLLWRWHVRRNLTFHLCSHTPENTVTPCQGQAQLSRQPWSGLPDHWKHVHRVLFCFVFCPSGNAETL